MGNNIEKLFCVVLVILLATELELVNSQKTVSFRFSDFKNKKPSLILQGSSQILASGALELTDPNNPDQNQVGRALYTTPIPIWDSATGNVASFITTFSFIIENVGTDVLSSGFVFFLAPPDTKIPENSGGHMLGVVESKQAINQFVGVEFDTYFSSDPWDPNYVHVGIDVNTVFSLKHTKWDRVSQALVEVTIIYDSQLQTLSVILKDSTGQFLTVAQVVDLRYVLPETVRIGFSASTSGPSRQLHTIQSWSFSSVLKTTTNSILKTTTPSSTNSNNTSSYVA
jgi:hypothetical protein